jgi:glycerophosphoryl diester phosphodiesterase
LKLIAHRGGRGFGTDNTLEAMQMAAGSGVRMIETDVRTTQDGELIVCHDGTIWGRVVSRTTYEELKRLDQDRPLLSEVLEELAGWVTFDIEVKEAPPREVSKILDAYNIGLETLVTSFNRVFLEELKSVFPEARTGCLYRMSYRNERKLQNAADIGAEIVLPYFNSIDEELVNQAHDLGLEVYAWTVNNEHDLVRLTDWGVDGVVTDRYLEFKDFMEGVRLAFQ